MTDTITYFSQNAPAGQEWMAYAVLPNGQRWQVYSMASTEQEAISKIVNLLNAEQAKVNFFKTANPNAETVAALKEAETHTGRGSHFVGKSWLINKTTREKISVPSGEVEAYVSSGEWQRGGPRSK